MVKYFLSLYLSLFGMVLSLEGPTLYPKNLKNWYFGCAKASGFVQRKPPHISNIRWLALNKARELSHCPNTNFSSSLGIKPDCCRKAKRLEGKVAIVTGASRGIGRGIASLFASEGATVILVGRNESSLIAVETAIRNKGEKAFHIQADVGELEDMERMAKEVVARYGKIDILCHNAGIYPEARLENMTLDEWQKVIHVNLTGTFLAVKACIPTMKAQGGGKIAIISSISGPETGLPGYSHYTASKGGISGFIKTAAIELAKYSININAIEPGNILTEGLESLGEEHLDNMKRAVPLGRLGTPQDVAFATLFLVSKDAEYITGQNLIVDGGQTLPESHFSPY